MIQDKGYSDDVSDPTRAARFDAGKPRLELVPYEIVEEMGRVFGFGCEKYGPWNWAKGFPWLQPFASMQRHLLAWHGGEDVDPESGLSHLAHAACNLAMLCHFVRHGIGTDNRLVRVREEWKRQAAEREFDEVMMETYAADIPTWKEDDERNAKQREPADYIDPDAVIPSPFEKGPLHILTEQTLERWARERGDTNRPKRVYLAGPMRGKPLHNFPAFDLARTLLRADGFDVWCPAEHDRAQGFDETKSSEEQPGFQIDDLLRKDLQVVLNADAIVLLPGWESSEGALAEAFVAARTGREVMEFSADTSVEKGFYLSYFHQPLNFICKRLAARREEKRKEAA